MSEQQAQTPRQPVQQQQQSQSAPEPVGQMVDAFDAQFKTIGIGAVSAAACIARNKPGQRQF